MKVAACKKCRHVKWEDKSCSYCTGVSPEPLTIGQLDNAELARASELFYVYKYKDTRPSTTRTVNPGSNYKRLIPESLLKKWRKSNRGTKEN